MFKLLGFVIVLINFQYTIQDCLEEVSTNGISVIWHQSSEAINIDSDPICYHNQDVIKRNCSNNEWSPPLESLKPCLKVVKVFDLATCPPGFHKISETNNDYCYEVGSPTIWNHPCFASGGASIITDLDEIEMNTLIDSLISMNISRLFWLPAQRLKLFNPVVWTIPGPNWGQVVENQEHLNFQNTFWKNCLALDIEQRTLITEGCMERFPSLCFYINNVHYPAVCPKEYHAFRYKPDDGTCYGIEHANNEKGLSYDEFLETKCQNPMSDDNNELNRFIFTKIANINKLPNNSWCWFNASINFETDFNNAFSRRTYLGLESIVNSVGTLGLINSSTALSCMACEKEVIYGETELMFEYNEVENLIYLTIYFPSGLWKYNYNDKGIQCFSDAKGFVGVVNINDLPYLSIEQDEIEGINYVEKVVYRIDLVTDRSAQYWCEGHTLVNFSLISTDKIVVNPKGKDVHVFSLTLNYYNITSDIQDLPDVENFLNYLTEELSVQKILLMDIFNVTASYITLLLHIHAPVINNYDDEALNILETYNSIKYRTTEAFHRINCTIVELASSVYCLPTISNNTIELEWELTAIGHISAPTQFCLQSNGLPVKRKCFGSYHTGGWWGSVEGHCDTNYLPTNTTTFLYSIVKGQVSSHSTARFLTEGLGYVLRDVGSIIPADIYYLSMSLQQILYIAQENKTSVDIGDIYNIAWVMDRVMELDCEYLRLAQTLNSTNVIINSVNEIIEIIAKQASNDTNTVSVESYNDNHIENTYQLAVEPQFVVQISYPKLNNITGVAISKSSNSDYFTDMIVQPLYANTSLEEVLLIPNLEIATWLPVKLLHTLKVNSNESDDNSDNKENLHIIVSVYQNDVVFPELTNSNHRINSRIVGVSIPGYLSNLKYPLRLLFNRLNHTESKGMCGFWDFQAQKSTQISGFWKTQGCFPVKSKKYRNITICECYHLTHFSQLIMIQGDDDKREHSSMNHSKALNVITLVGSFLSLLGIVGIWITALVFANWRKKAGTKVLLQLSTAIAMPLLFIVITNLDNTIFVIQDDVYVIAEHMRPACIALGVLLHYSILASFMWMLITAVLQFIRYVRVLGVSRPSRFMFKFTLIGWGIPLIPVIVVLCIDVENYIPASSIYKSICYPKGYYFILAVMVPICIILLVNVVLFILVLHAISRGPNDKMKSSDMDLVGAQLRLSIFLFFLLGLTWIFGIFSFTKNLLWSYLFCLTSTLQGFVLFIYFIICDPATRNLWITLMKPPFTATSSRNSISSMS